jgi:hypothetical protein
VTFDPASVPAGVTQRLVPFWSERPLITPRSMLAHTMAASVRTSVAGAWRHTNAAPGVNTLPHYALGMEADDDGCCKFLPTNRRGIANATVSRGTEVNGRLVWPTLTDEQRASIDAHGNIRDWSLAIETADTGYLADPGISPFTEYQLEMLVRIYVHELGGWGIPAAMLGTWWGAGMGTHTLPFEFPFTTIHRGKFCPGARKKEQFLAIVVPEVQRRLGATPPAPAPTPPPPAPLPPTEEDELMFIQRTIPTPTDKGRLVIGDHADAAAYDLNNEADAEAVDWAIWRAKQAGRPLLSMDGNGRIVTVDKVDDVQAVSPRAVRSLGE